MTTLREAVAERENDYAPLASRYLAAAGCDLVSDPLASFHAGPLDLTRTTSVLIGTYNAVASLVPALVALEHSSLNQRHPQLLEVIVVDDGSTDGTREAVLGLELDLRWTYIRQRRGGLSTAHNTGLAFAEGDIVVFSDSDMVHLPYTIEELVKRHQLLPHVTLIGFRVMVDPADPRLDPAALPAALSHSHPEFWLDHRLHFPGWPTNICRDTRHLLDFGARRQLTMCDGSLFELESLVVGALCSFERADLLGLGGSDERLIGYGAEDTLIGARMIALGNPVIPVYSAVAWHVHHIGRSDDEPDQLARNRRMLAAIYDEPFGLAVPELRRWRARALEVVQRRGRTTSRRGDPPDAYPPPPVDPAAALVWGAAAAASGRHRDALAHYEASIAFGPTPAAHTGRARALLELGDPVSAEGAARAAGGTGLELPFALAAQGQYGRARDELQSLAAAAGAEHDASWAVSLDAVEHKRRANIHAEQGLHRIAVTGFELALIAEPEYAWAHFDRGLSLRALGRERDAIASVRRAGALMSGEDPSRAWVHGALGELHLAVGEAQRAVFELDRALRIDPGNGAAAAARARVASPLDVPVALGAWNARVPPVFDDVPGWFSPAEAALLSASVILACEGASGNGSIATAPAPAIVELGSYYGRSTISIAWTLRELTSRRLDFYAVDPHANYAYGGCEDTEAAMRANLARHDVADLVSVQRMCSHEFTLEQPIALLFIDALHEYEDVRRDYEHFRDQLVDAAVVAFHDYDPCCPGVMRYVDELLDAGDLEFRARDGMLIVLSRPA